MPSVNGPSHSQKSANGKPNEVPNLQLPSTQATVKSHAAAPVHSSPRANQEVKALPSFTDLLRKAAMKKEPLSDEESLVLDVEKRFDKLNSLWKSAEEQIRRFMVPKEVIHNYRTYQDASDRDAVEHDMYIREAIAWAKARGAWRLCHGYYDESWDQGSGERGYSFTPVLDASFEIRQACIPAFAEFRNLIIEEAKQTIPKLDDAIAQLAASLR